MKYGEILVVLPTAVAAIRNPLPAAPEPHLAARQQATRTTTTSGLDEFQATSCVSIFWAREALASSLEAEQPAPLTSYWSALYRSATDQCGSVVAVQTAPPMPDPLLSIYADWESSARSAMFDSEPPLECDSVINDILLSRKQSRFAAQQTCLKAYSSSVAAAAATTASSTPAATSAATATSAGTPANTGAAGRSGVSASLALGAMAVFGYFGLV
ncbi:hypothetical protein MCOR27_005483 [Pyricularia oryzae]|uniref:Infection structure specific protein n=1 Tax=Pyricularia grisea TaxID=148305 RepID=A0ABQ8NDF0_PYRGI|nr:hypothetical protein MCOR01_009143 [Pyricularia oryzae]KAI6295261.1 hypothetical protein MCOR33_007826 [Pyricularia grisea]KAI6260418.1 hypothetical protein MCOR19_003319 [Pyricularia oryzae]KAI6269369.1 hypothetical protein MCOR26_008733 [Pyricularia oryzae]KAI6278763.1 hypothetical protein MCOR27_005483 [Pyricularia oryzae]